MVMLAIDTSTAATSAAILDGEQVLASAEHVDARRHAELLAPMIAELLDAVASPISSVAVGVGPGPYTGLRVGIATAQALALGWGLPAVGICSLDVLAAEAVAAGMREQFIAAGDARRREVYWAAYGADGSRVRGPFVGAAAQVDAEASALPWVGEGALVHRPDAVPESMRPVRFPRATVLGALAQRLLAQGEVPAAPQVELSAHGEDDGATARSLGAHRLLTLAPLYVRRPDAAEPGAVA